MKCIKKEFSNGIVKYFYKNGKNGIVVKEYKIKDLKKQLIRNITKQIHDKTDKELINLLDELR